MKAHQAIFPIATMARVLGVSNAGYYAWAEQAWDPTLHAGSGSLRRASARPRLTTWRTRLC